MTSKYATNSNLLTQLPNPSTGTNSLVAQLVFRRTGIPVEGQTCKSYNNLSGTIAAGTFTTIANGGANYCLYELNKMAAGTSITLNATDLQNMVGKHYVFANPAFGTGTTDIVLPSTASWNNTTTATHTATFSTTAPGYLEFSVGWDTVANAPVVFLGYNLNITFA